jgi:hypothetical protein
VQRKHEHHRAGNPCSTGQPGDTEWQDTHGNGHDQRRQGITNEGGLLGAYVPLPLLLLQLLLPGAIVALPLPLVVLLGLVQGG